MSGKGSSAEAQINCSGSQQKAIKWKQYLGNLVSAAVSNRTTKLSEEWRVHCWYLGLCPESVHMTSSQSSALCPSLLCWLSCFTAAKATYLHLDILTILRLPGAIHLFNYNRHVSVLLPWGLLSPQTHISPYIHTISHWDHESSHKSQ